MTTPNQIRRLLEQCRRQRDPDLLNQARSAFQHARAQAPNDEEWRDVARYGKRVSAVIEDPASLPWVPTPDGVGLIAQIDDDDYLVVHPHAGVWRAGTAWPGGEQPTFWNRERFPSREAAINAAAAVTIPPAPSEATT